MGELKDGQVVRVTDYWREPFARSEWRRGLSDLKRPGTEELTADEDAQRKMTMKK